MNKFDFLVLHARFLGTMLETCIIIWHGSHFTLV